ncbi:MAG: PIN domain-containing protein [Devosia sp.]|nr:PIN domain-containing protein [Devosia sp.]
MPGSFLDSNVLIYLASGDAGKARRAEAVLAAGGTVSVQVLNEIANIGRRKMGLDWSELGDFLGAIRALVTVVPLTVETHLRGLKLAERHALSLYDAMIVAAALEAGCNVLLSEDMHDGLVVEDSLRIANPFR